MNNLSNTYITPYAKAWAALFTSIVTLVVTIFGLNLDPTISAAIVTLGTTLAVWAIPNRG